MTEQLTELQRLREIERCAEAVIAACHDANGSRLNVAVAELEAALHLKATEPT